MNIQTRAAEMASSLAGRVGQGTHSLDERLLMCSDGVEVLQVKFHPGSVRDNHILLLTSDNTLRLYQIEDEVINLGVFPVGDKPMAKVPCSRITFLGALGEIAVDFDFGHPEINHNSKNDMKHKKEESSFKSLVKIHDPLNESNTIIGIHRPEKERKKNEKIRERENYSNFNWPVYILSGDFIITTINIPLYENAGSCIVSSPLPALPCSLLQCDKRACSIICLNSTPQVICIGSTNGEILQGVVVPIEEDEIEEDANSKRISLPDTSKPDREIYFFEAVDIELGLATTLPQQEEGYTCPIFLHKDESRCDRFFATHSAGIHTITVGCMEDLQNFGISENNNSRDIFSISSTPEYLVCTKTTTTKTCNPVIGFSVCYNPNSLIALLANGSLISLALITTTILPKLENLTLKTDETTTSPIKEMLKVPFEHFIRNLLKKAESQPIMKLSSHDEHSLKECHELIQKTAQVFKEKLKYQTIVMDEIEKRSKALQVCSDYQLEELENMHREKCLLQENAEALAEKYEDIREKQEMLLKRSAKVLVLLSLKKEDLSDAEKEYLIKLKKVREKLDKSESIIDKLIIKKNYQETQMRSWKNQQQKKSNIISDKHKDTIKENLMASSTRINDMVEQIKLMKDQLLLK
ncbi:hypothetical protein WA026_021601 [Henosepilachna vigintioctopunctata]|uniref:Nuclear pore complex protein Nup88 n=1 Tax=Henosepilachna vigintioctopunctata TaxID=420089 RepID=A0AAW1V1R6_9CUCU